MSDPSDDDQKHQDANSADEAITDEESPLGTASSDVQDIDETLESVGLPSDESGPQELDIDKAVTDDDKHH